MSWKKTKLKTVSEKISESFLPREEIDPENDPESLVKIADFDDAEDNFDFDAKPSEIRKRNIKLLSEFSEKYQGKVTSRRELEEHSDEESNSDQDDSEDSELEAYRSKQAGSASKEDSDDEDGQEDSDQSENETHEINGKGNDDSDENDEEGEEEDSEDDDDDFEQDSDYASSAENQDNTAEDETQLMTESNQNAEIQKGLAVQSQLKIWEKLLEIRIHSQKVLSKANCLPVPATFNELSDESAEFSNLAKQTATNVERLLVNMLDMQRTLASQYSELKSVFKSSKKRSSNSGKSNSEPPIKRYADELGNNFESLTPYRNSVLQKWDDRTKILAPGATMKKGKSLSDNFDVIRKIEAVLLNKSDLLAKSQTVKGTYRLFGQQPQKDDQDNDDEGQENGHQGQDAKVMSSEIYDDTDFYHQQLRELIEYKSNTSSNPAEMTKQFAELQKLRQKMKKKVDTRASKGRKIRYVVHNKLVNFIAPNANSEWTEESKNELYRSLFAT